MKKILLLLLICGIIYSSFAQSTSDIGKITLSVIMPETVAGLNASQLSKLETKITQIVSSHGVASSSYNNNFVIYPKFAIYDTSVVEGGMKNIVITTCELSLFIKQVDNNLLFSSISKQVKGSGNNKDVAITNAISTIAVNNVQFENLMEDGKSKILQYYSDKCQDIIFKSEGLAQTHDFEGAIGLLQAIPEGVDCYYQTQEKSIEIYKLYQNQKCGGLIHEAKTLLASNSYSGALEILSQIDPSSICFQESKTLIEDIGSKIDAEEKREWDLKLKIYNDDIKLKQQRINAIKDIAVNYYKSQPESINYNYIVK